MKRIRVTLDHFEGDVGILLFGGKLQFKMPKSILKDAKAGDGFVIDIKTEKEAKLSEPELAKAILNQIFNS